MSEYYLYKIKGLWPDIHVDREEILETNELPIEYAKHSFYEFFHEEQTTTYSYGNTYFLGCIVDIKKGNLFNNERRIVDAILILKNKNELADKLNQLKYMAGYLFMDIDRRNHAYMDKHRKSFNDSKEVGIPRSLELLKEYTDLLK